jgi:putative oxidoreductase
MSALSSVQRAGRLGLAVTGALAFLPPLLTRLVMGQAYFFTGRGKLEHLDRVVAFFSSLGIPLPGLNAAFVAHLEFYGSMALVLGLATRLVAAGLGTTMLVALATADRESFIKALSLSGDTGLTDVVPLVFGLLLLWLVIAGPGLVSLDALIARRLRRGQRAAEAGRPPTRA